MKKYIKVLSILVLFATIFVVTGCEKKDDPTKDFKNPKTIEYKTDKGTLKLTYDDNGEYEVTNNDPYVTLRNTKEGYRIDMDYSNNTVEQQNKSKGYFEKDSKYTIVDNVKFRDYEGYTQIENTYGTANVYLTLDKDNDVVSNIKVSGIRSSEVADKISEGTKPEDALYNLESVQQILKTVQYEK